MSYNGYLLKINNLLLPYVEAINVFQNGSYSFNKESRIVNNWTDITGKDHHEVSNDEKAVISFTIKDRDITLQQKIKELFETNENIFVEYYDGFENTYKEGYFYLDNKEETVGIATQNNVYYKPINIVLKEY